MQARLKVLHNKANVKQVKLLPVTLIGRSTECNLKIASSQVSRTHCRITLGEDTVYVEDLGSANGTTVDGKRLEAHKPQSVLPGATLVVGPASFLIDYVASTSATMILSRFDASISPSLSSTELLIPARKEAAALLAAPVANPVAVPVASAIPVAKPVAGAGVAAQGTAIPIAAAVARPVAASANVVAKPVLPPVAAEQEEPPVEMSFAGFGPATDEPGEIDSSQFLFGQPASEGGAASSFFVSPTTAPAPKRGSGKSLFSMFGRKAKGGAATPSPATSSKAPSVFLPTMDRAETDASTIEADAEPMEFRFGEQTAGESAAGTVTLEDSPTATPPAATPAPAADPVASTPPAADGEDGFQQFLKQL